MNSDLIRDVALTPFNGERNVDRIVVVDGKGKEQEIETLQKEGIIKEQE